MKILHTSDWHLGRTVYGRSLQKDQEYFVEESFFPLLEKERPDCVIIAGDIFDRQVAPVEAIRLFGSVVEKMVGQLGIPTFLIAGNHDGAGRMALAPGLLRNSGLFVASVLEPQEYPVVLKDKWGEVHFHLLPYFDLPQAREVLHKSEEEVRTFREAYAEILKRIEKTMDPAVRHVLVGHFFAAGSAPSQSETAIFVGGSGQVEPVLFSGFDYTALGHIHSAQKVGEKGRYSGSPLKYSFDEEHHKKSLTMVYLEEKGEVRTEEYPIVPFRDMRTIKGTFEELRQLGERERVSGKAGDYVLAELTDNVPIFEPVARLREVYPNLLGLTTSWMKHPAGDGEREQLRKELAGQKLGDLTIFREFMRQVCGEEALEDDEAVFREAYRRAGEETSHL